MKNDVIVLGRLDLDVNSVVDKLEKFRKQLADLSEVQRKLESQGQTQSSQYKNNVATIIALNDEYKVTDAILSRNLMINEAYIKTQLRLDYALQEVMHSENEHINNNEKLLKLRKDLKRDSANYAENISLINAKLEQNSNWLKENGSDIVKLNTTMGYYKNQVAESFASINILNGGLSGFTTRAQEAGGAGPLLKNAFAGITGGIKGMGAAIVANPVGLILTLLMPIIQGVFEVFKKFTPLMNVLEQAMAAVDAIIQSIANSFLALMDPAKSASEVFSEMGNNSSKAAAEAVKLKKAQQELRQELELQDVRNEKAKGLIADQIALSKDITLTEGDRIKAFKKAAQIETENFKQRKKQSLETYNNAVAAIANGKNLTDEEIEGLKRGGLAYAQKLMKVKSIGDDEIKALKDAQIKREGVFAEEKTLIATHNEGLGAMHKDFREERERLEKEAHDAALRRQEEHEKKKQEFIAAALQKQKLKLETFVQSEGDKAKSLADELKFLEEVKNKKLAIAQSEYNASKKTANDALQLKIEKGAAEIESAKATADATAAYAHKELDLYIQLHPNILEGKQQLTQELITEEEKRLQHIKDAKERELQLILKTNDAEIEAKRKNNEQLAANDLEYLAKKGELDSEFKKTTNANNKALDDQEKARVASEAQAQQRINIANAQTKYDGDLIVEQARFDEELVRLKDQLDKKQITLEQYDQLRVIATEEHNNKEKEISLAKNTAVASQYATLFGNISQLLGKKTAAGKAAAIAEATMNTYNGVTQVWASASILPEPFATASKIASTAVVVASGLKAVKQIAGTKTPKAEKGALFSIGGNRHSNGGTLFTGADGTRFEAEQGELIGVMNRNAAAHFMAFNNAFPAGGSSAPNYFAGGGIVSREVAQQSVNIDELAAKIALANRSLPTPVVAVQDIVAQSNSYVQVRDAANF